MALFIKIFVIDTSQPPKGEAFPVKLEVLLPLCGWPPQKGAALPVELDMLLPLWVSSVRFLQQKLHFSYVTEH